MTPHQWAYVLWGMFCIGISSLVDWKAVAAVLTFAAGVLFILGAFHMSPWGWWDVPDAIHHGALWW